jgi:uncharacterized protein YbjT (DUF2867 family)
MNSFPPYVITGANGRTGSAAALKLLEQGEAVKVVLRDGSRSEMWRARGATVAIADLTDLDAVISAFSNAKAVYVVSPQEYGRQDLFERAAAIAEVVAKAAADASVPKIVALSSVGADRENGTGWIMMNRLLEQRLLPLAVPTTFIRAAYFMENWTSLIGVAMDTGILPSFLSPAGQFFPMVAAADVGRIAASILVEDWDGRRIIAVVGPRQYTPSHVAQYLAEEAGAPIAVSALPIVDWPTALSTAGFSETALRGFIEMTDALNSGFITFMTTVAHTSGRERPPSLRPWRQWPRFTVSGRMYLCDISVRLVLWRPEQGTSFVILIRVCPDRGRIEM